VILVLLGSLSPLEFDFTLQTVALGAALLGGVAGALGSFALLRRQSLLGDAISHAALPGIVLAFLLSGSRAMPVLVLGAALAGWIGMLSITAILRNGRLPEDTALGIVLSVFFGFGLVLLTWTQGRPDAGQAGLDTFLFGQAATLLPSDVALIAGVGVVLLGIVTLLWKEFRLLTFDPGYAAALGLPVARLDLILTGALVAAIVLGLQAVGVVLMSTLLVAPAAAARQWTRSLGGLVLVSGVFGAGAGFTGAVISATGARLPTGPVVVLVATVGVLLSLLLAPERGAISGWIRRLRTRRQLRVDAVLLDLFALSQQHPEGGWSHPAATLQVMGGRARGAQVSRCLGILEAQGLALRDDETSRQGWVITEAGVAKAQRLVRRLGGLGDGAS